MSHFATRLNELFRNPPEQVADRCTNRQVARSLQAAGHRISAPYLSQLRSGGRSNPSWRTVAALADYFQVEPDYFFARDLNGSNVDDNTLLARLQLDRPRLFLVQTIGLSRDSIDLLVTMAEHLRSSEGLLDIHFDS
ncbi:helix-turn-helix domain-containing protein [Nocardia caishijiensis]|uniref:HTH cro/C1-type domain-containing protein n=1 Tax=Nocardia caishijiensis TaxID=184756 RepID=A0ABQ6YI38_9NOCA|nr:helix-turn-helix domain-containing protein [Nocardia caishijiensis]KAF0845445.1 hypothetical protein FNL39_10746 [Nocardia caishijiensis]